jgi:hypothetical protein
MTIGRHRVHGGQIEKHRRAIMAAFTVQGRGDQVPDTTRGQHVL